MRMRTFAFIALLTGFAATTLLSLFFVSLVSSPLDKTLIKRFLYDATGEPIAGLNVSLYNETPHMMGWQLTNATGHVRFGGLNDGTYTLKWMWGGTQDCEQFELTCDRIVWEFTNRLQSKSGGGTKAGVNPAYFGFDFFLKILRNNLTFIVFVV